MAWCLSLFKIQYIAVVVNGKKQEIFRVKNILRCTKIPGEHQLFIEKRYIFLGHYDDYQTIESK
jgi:hypothetical protein